MLKLSLRGFIHGCLGRVLISREGGDLDFDSDVGGVIQTIDVGIGLLDVAVVTNGCPPN